MRNQKGFTLIEALVLVVIILVFVGTVRSCISLSQSLKLMEKRGLKSYVEEIWHGENHNKGLIEDE